MDYKTIRQKYPIFLYNSFTWKIISSDLHISFDFQAGNQHKFKSKIIIKKIDPKKLHKSQKYIDNLVFNIGMVELLSYWKAFCSPKIIVKAGFLEKYQIKWWEKLLRKGMGQYFYENKIDLNSKSFVGIYCEGKLKYTKPYKVGGEKILIPIGGGKDSAVTLELLSNHFKNTSAFLVNPSKASKDCVGAKKTNSVEVMRSLDKKIIELNKKGYLNGHVPFTASLSFISILVAILGEFRYIAFSNEQSSNEENVIYKGQKINHQYSKSFEFENDFREYNNKYLSDVEYFSFLRPIYDIQIAKVFSRYPKYHSIIRSCNIGQRTNTWCGKCSKCFSTFILFYPFMKDSAIDIFGKDLLEDRSLKPVVNSLISDNTVKPFECVGTRHELRVALGLEKDEKILNYWGGNNLPIEFKLLLYFNLNFAGKKILILGYGREGKSTERILKKYLPLQKYDIEDKKGGEGYLSGLDKYDIVFKSPGIPNKLSEIKSAKSKSVVFTSQTKVFLDLLRDKTVGVTGTKGKSTTASLIYHILKNSSVGSELVGNIGKPVLDYLGGGDKEKTYVFEMSSHQLSDITSSPHVAVFLNIFPEHLDYYENYQDYVNAKTNIYKYQNKNDFLIYNGQFEKIIQYIQKSKGKNIDFSLYNLPSIKTQLLGAHNKDNIKAAFVTVNKLGVDIHEAIDAIKTFKPLADRLEVVGTVNNVTFINDGLATIPEATITAVDSLDQDQTLILGGFDRGVGFDKLAIELAKRKKVKNVVLIGQTSKKIENSLKKYSNINTYNLGVAEMDQIVVKAFEVTPKGGVVLLSPASPSFDMYKDYKDRDNQFKEAVKNL